MQIKISSDISLYCYFQVFIEIWFDFTIDSCRKKSIDKIARIASLIWYLSINDPLYNINEFLFLFLVVRYRKHYPLHFFCIFFFDESFLKKILANNNTNEYSNVWIPAVSTTYQELSLNKELNNIDHRNINGWMLGMILFINHVVIINHHVNQIMFDSLIKHVGVTLDWETN